MKIYWLSHNIQPNLWLWFLFLYSFPVGSSDLYVTCRIKWESDLLCAVEHPRLFWFQWESRDLSIAFFYSSFLHLDLLVFSLTHSLFMSLTCKVTSWAIFSYNSQVYTLNSILYASWQITREYSNLVFFLGHWVFLITLSPFSKPKERRMLSDFLSFSIVYIQLTW